MHICMNFNGNPSGSCWDISIYTEPTEIPRYSQQVRRKMYLLSSLAFHSHLSGTDVDIFLQLKAPFNMKHHFSPATDADVNILLLLLWHLFTYHSRSINWNECKQVSLEIWVQDWLLIAKIWLSELKLFCKNYTL